MNQNVHEPITAQTKNSRNQKQHEPKRARTKKWLQFFFHLGIETQQMTAI